MSKLLEGLRQEPGHRLWLRTPQLRAIAEALEGLVVAGSIVVVLAVALRARHTLEGVVGPLVRGAAHPRLLDAPLLPDGLDGSFAGGLQILGALAGEPLRISSTEQLSLVALINAGGNSSSHG